jgi:cell division protein FtsL
MKLKRAGIIAKIVILALAVYATVSLVNLKAKVTQAQECHDRLEQEVAQAEMENSGLSYDIAHSGDDATIEDIARDKLGLVKPGEKIFYDIGN